VAGPRRLRRAARTGMLLYGTALLSAMKPTDASRPDPLVPVALATMHAAHGVGFLHGAYRWGIPWSALRRVVLGPREERTGAEEGPIEALSPDPARAASAEGPPPDDARTSRPFFRKRPPGTGVPHPTRRVRA